MKRIKVRLIYKNTQKGFNNVTKITAYSTKGQFTILPDHATLLAALTSPSVTIYTNDKPHTFKITEGFLHFDKNNTLIVIPVD